METRKLQQVGGGTFTVSVPKAWAVEHGLSAGSEVHIYPHGDGSLVVRGAEHDGESLDAVRIDLEGGQPALVERALRAANAVGFETVTLRSRDGFTDEQRRRARQVTREVVGTTVVAEGRDELTVRTLLDATDVSIRQSVVQLQFVALSIHRAGTEAFVDAGGDARERLTERVGEAHRLSAMVTRHFNRSLVSLGEVDRLGLSRTQLYEYDVAARELSSVADLGASIARLGERRVEPLSAEEVNAVERAAEAARTVVDGATSSLLSGDGPSSVYTVLDRRDEAMADLEDIDCRLVDGSPATHALTRFVDDLVRTLDHGEAIAETALRVALRSGVRPSVAP